MLRLKDSSYKILGSIFTMSNSDIFSVLKAGLDTFDKVGDDDYHDLVLDIQHCLKRGLE